MNSDIEAVSIIDLSDEFLSEEEVNHYMNLDEKEGFEKTGE